MLLGCVGQLEVTPPAHSNVTSTFWSIFPRHQMEYHSLATHATLSAVAFVHQPNLPTFTPSNISDSCSHSNPYPYNHRSSTTFILSLIVSLSPHMQGHSACQV